MKITVPFSLKGSEIGDILSDSEDHPFEPCPGSPNCIVVSKSFNITPDKLFPVTSTSLQKMNPFQIKTDSQSLKVKAVFRIPVFLFKDDFQIIITANNASSILHVKSNSRVGHSDLGVNRRRVQKFLSLLTWV